MPVVTRFTFWPKLRQLLRKVDQIVETEARRLQKELKEPDTSLVELEEPSCPKSNKASLTHKQIEELQGHLVICGNLRRRLKAVIVGSKGD